MTTFTDLGIGAGYVKSLRELGIVTPTKIQATVISSVW